MLGLPSWCPNFEWSEATNNTALVQYFQLTKRYTVSADQETRVKNFCAWTHELETHIDSNPSLQFHRLEMEYVKENVLPAWNTHLLTFHVKKVPHTIYINQKSGLKGIVDSDWKALSSWQLLVGFRQPALDCHVSSMVLDGSIDPMFESRKRCI
jgi:hypothetical protein